MSMHDPENFARIVRGMIDIQKHEGWLPECREMGTKQCVFSILLIREADIIV